MAEPVKPDVAAPTFCPFCRSKELTTASKVINESTYWRCVPCGEIWNPGRLRPSAPPGISRRW